MPMALRQHPRNQFLGPRFKTIDFAVIKNTAITERVSAQFRVEMFNVFNILNLAPRGRFPCGHTGSCGDEDNRWPWVVRRDHQHPAPAGLARTSAGEPFNAQFALKIIF